MALNLSTLTSPATSDDVLAEVLTTADFLEPVPVLRNLARGSNKGGDAKQDVALNQPKALPLIDGDGYLYLPQVNGNYVSFPSANLTGEHEVTIKISSPAVGNISGQIYEDAYQVRSYGSFFRINTSSGYVNIGIGNPNSTIIGKKWVKITYVPDNGTGNLEFAMYVSDNGSSWTSLGSGTLPSFTLVPPANTTISSSIAYPVKGAIFEVIVKDGINGQTVRHVDFTATNVRHNDTKFQCATGQTVTINQSGNDPATIIKKPVLRFDGVDDFMNGVFNQTITDGYMFAAFSVLGDGGEGNARIFGMNQTGFNDTFAGGFFFGRADARVKFATRYNGSPRSDVHLGLFSKTVGDILLESDFVDGSQTSKINNADEDNGANTTIAGDLSAEEFKIASYTTGDNNSALDLEYLALFPADSVPDEATASRIRNYINNRNTVFLRHDTDGYYFYNPQDLSSGAVTTWNGRIVGSDNGDADKNATQSTSADQPTSDGYKVTFADNTDHFDIPSTTQAGWQVVGTSRGTFAYKVNANAVTELNLLGNLGNASYRQAGDLYGIILLPTSATGREIEQARKLLIDRGAADGANSSSFYAAWDQRADMVEFKNVDMSSVTSVGYAWRNTALTSFSTPLPLVTHAREAWNGCTSLSDFGTTEISNCSNFISSWQNCSALTSFPEDAKLGTEASNVNFASAWRSSGLTSFSTPLPTATSVNRAWQSCSSLSSFSSDLSSVTDASYAWYSTSLVIFSSQLPSVTTLNQAFHYCYNLESFDLVELPLLVDARYAWRNCTSLTSFDTRLPKVAKFNQTWDRCTSLSDFSADVFSNWNPASINSAVFNNTWANCTSLTAQSVENILTSIDSTGKYATSTGLSGGTALADAGIDIDYDVSTGSLSAATNAAIRSLDTKGWQVFINGEIRTGVELLDLQGFYFFESEGLAAANVTSWDSSIGASSASLDLVGTQTDANDQPVADGTVVTFADNTDHIDITSTTQAGWQVVGTSLGTFAYKVNANAVTELNLLGNLGNASYRQAGDLYGIILLPESATGREINEAKKLLTDRGASEGATADVTSAWQNRSDIVQFDGGDMSSVTNAYRAWRYSSSLTSFSTDLPSATNASAAWYGCSSLESFNTELPLATTVNSTWGACSSLESFNTELPLATSVYQAWYQCSSLESFSTDLPSATNVSQAWYNCTSLTSFSTPLPSATNATYAWRDCSSLTSFSTALPSVTNVASAWRNCSSLTSFSTDLTSATNAQSSWFSCSSLESFSSELPSVVIAYQTWRGCSSLTSFSTELPSVTNATVAWSNCTSLTDFSADVFSNWNPSSIVSGVFNDAWDGCTSLTAQSVENILTSIDASGKYASSDGTSGGTALADAGIDIDYNGDPLSAATTAAITSLKAKGWSIIVNNVTL